MPVFPISLELTGRKCLVVGAGSVGLRKVQNLLACLATVTVVAPAACAEILALDRRGEITYLAREYEPGDIQGCALVFAATSLRSCNEAVYWDCKTAGVPINVVDDPEHCTFTVPAVVRRGSLTLAIATDGKSPILARRLRERLEQEIGPEYGTYLELLGTARETVRNRFEQESQRKAVLEAVTALEVMDLIRQGQIETARERMLECIFSWLD
ncbi:MAG: bifunctional precorrin-2 dehydrogenase/sirohydrochlorin ferrochelatase [Solirubrobacterales bacterium]